MKLNSVFILHSAFRQMKGIPGIAISKLYMQVTILFAVHAHTYTQCHIWKNIHSLYL